jgi:polyhydroxyalkanoate synthesis regulator phasin
MGEERAWKRKHVFIRRACCLSVLLGFIGCLPPVKEWQGRQTLREAESLMARGEYEASMDESLRVLEAHPMTLGDRAVFQMGLLYAHPENPRADYEKAILCFERIPREFPLSEKKEEARLWLLTLRAKDELRRKVKGVEQAAEAKEKKVKLLQGELEERDKKLMEEQKEIDQLRNRVTELEAQLSKLKNVDLTIEKKKRAPQP